MKGVTRRQFIGTMAAVPVAGVELAQTSSPEAAGAQAARGFRGTICFFSKHLPLMDARNLGRTVKRLGFDGVDLTVRPKGHIEPARVAEDLPPFVEGIRSEGVSVPMITTGTD